jgi:hypothetical protein
MYLRSLIGKDDDDDDDADAVMLMSKRNKNCLIRNLKK